MSSSRHPMGRRQFLVSSSVGALAAVTLGPKLFAAGGGAPKRLAVGFAGLDETATVFAAARVPAADGGFIGRGARISVSGASGASARPIERRAVELLAHYSYDEGGEQRVAPFRAWAGSRLTGCQGNTVNFTVPVDETENIALSVETERGAPQANASRRDALTISAPEVTALPVTLSLGRGGDSLKLVRGFYVIAPLFENDSEPSWSGYALNKVGGRWALADRDGNVAPFEHFVLRIDYAS